MITLVDKIPSSIVDQVEKWVTSSKIPWFYFDHTLGYDPKGYVEVQQDKYIIKDLPRFTHYFYPNSKTHVEDRTFVMPLTEWIKREFLKGYNVQRIMGNMTTQMPDASRYLNLPHMDSDKNKFTFLYYVNSSDGNTVFFKDSLIYKEVQPIS